MYEPDVANQFFSSSELKLLISLCPRSYLAYSLRQRGVLIKTINN